MSSSYLIFATLAMALATFITRALPAILPHRLLKSPYLYFLNKSLPLSVLVLLIFTSIIQEDTFSQSFSIHSAQIQLLLAQIGALILVLLVHHLFRQFLVSMVTGIIALNFILWLIN